MVDAQHGGGHKPGKLDLDWSQVLTWNCIASLPGQSHYTADGNQAGEYKQIQVIATSLLQLILLTIDNHGRYLLVHKDENGAQHGREYGNEWRPNGVLLVERRYKPTTCIQCGFQLVGYFQFLCGHTQLEIEEGHGEYGNQHREITDILPHDRWEEEGILEFLEYSGQDEGAGTQDDGHKENIFGWWFIATITEQCAIV